MSETIIKEQQPTVTLGDDIIEHQAVYPVSVGTSATEQDEEIPVELSKRELARQKRAELLQQQAQLQQLLDEIDDDQDAGLQALREQVAELKEEVASWKQPENPHSVLAQIGLFALAASLICWLVGPLIAGQSGYLDGALHSAAVLLGYVAAALLLFVVAKGNQH